MTILFAWDFHGVLEKDNDLAVMEVCNKVLEELNLSMRITLEEVRKLYGARWYDYFNYLLPNFSPDKKRKCAQRGIKIGLRIAANYIKPNDWAEYVLKEITKKGHHNIVVSTSTPAVIEWFVECTGLKRWIRDCFGIDPEINYHSAEGQFDRGLEKARIIKEYARKIENLEKIVAIGDTKEDIKAGRLCGATTYLYTYPYLLKRKEIEADYHITDLREILKEIKK